MMDFLRAAAVVLAQYRKCAKCGNLTHVSDLHTAHESECERPSNPWAPCDCDKPACERCCVDCNRCPRCGETFVSVDHFWKCGERER
jgi:hypothetical protein